jgi:hypothetical protein
MFLCVDIVIMMICGMICVCIEMLYDLFAIIVDKLYVLFLFEAYSLL